MNGVLLAGAQPWPAGRQGDARMSAAKFTKRDLKKKREKKKKKKKEGKDIKKGEREKKRKERKRRRKKGNGRNERKESMAKVCVRVRARARVTDNYGSLPMFRSDFIAGPSLSPDDYIACHAAAPFHRSEFRYRVLRRNRYDFN